MAKSERTERIDPEWPGGHEDEHPVSELAADRQGALSPYGDTTFPVEHVPYVHPHTEISK